MISPADKLIGLVCCMIAVLPIKSFGQATSAAAPCLQAAVAFEQERFAQAAPLFEACRRSSGELAPLLQAAKSYYWAAQYDKAAELATEFLGGVPTSSSAMYLLGHIEERRKHPRDSLQWFTHAAALEPPRAGDLRTVALDYVLLNDYPDAIHWLQRAVNLDSKDPEAWYDLGRAQMTQGDMPAAEVSLRRALKLQPRMVKAEDNLGVTLEAENRNSEAVEAYRLAVAWQAEAPHQSEQPLLNLGTLLLAEQCAQEAVPLLRQAAVLAPDSAKAHEQLGRALEATGQLPAALKQMDEAIRLEPKDARLHYELGQMARRAGDERLSREQLRLSSELYGKTSSANNR